MRRFQKSAYWIETSIVVTLLGMLILLSSAQILLRNLFDYGLPSAEPLLRAIVLWLGMVGAIVASRGNRHLKIDLLSRFLKPRSSLWVQSLAGLVTAAICLLIAWYGYQWVKLEYADGMLGFAGIPSWILQAIVPLSFILIALRYCLSSLAIGRYFLRRRHQRRKNAG
jgi:TRAP-type C4-dicarboxylate transport system permease small subunit